MKKILKKIIPFFVGIVAVFIIGLSCDINKEDNNIQIGTVVATNTTEIATNTTKLATDTTLLVATSTTTLQETTTTLETTESTTTTSETRKFLAFNPNSYIIHYNTCKYYDDSMEEINGNYVEIGRKCSYCNPDIIIETVYTEPQKQTTTIETTTTTTIVETVEQNIVEEESSSDGVGITYVKNFSRGTYYAYGGSRVGGSGRTLIDCSYGDGYVNGSIASSYLYQNYGYNYNGGRTMVYLEISGYPEMNGYYYLDDSDAGNPNVIDFFYYTGSNCQFSYQGVVSVDCYIVN